MFKTLIPLNIMGHPNLDGRSISQERVNKLNTASTVGNSSAQL